MTVPSSTHGQPVAISSHLLSMSSDHLARQLRFVVPGACITLWLRTPSLIARIWTEAAPFARFVSAIVCHPFT